MIPLRDDIPARGEPRVVRALFLLNVLAFIAQIVVGPELITQFALVPTHLVSWWQEGPWVAGFVDNALPLLTSQFLHAGWLHLLSNLLFLWIFADNVEGEIGSGPFLAFYLLAGVLAGLTHVYFEPTSDLPTVGASGAIAGVLGAYFVRFSHARVLTLVPIFIFPFLVEIPAVIFLGLWFLLQVLYGMNHAAGHIAVWAHAGGFVAGILLLGIFPRARRKKPAPRYKTVRFERNR